MNPQIKKGLIDACVLTLLAREASYGYAITSELQEVLDINESTLYPVLRRLEKSGCLTTFQRPYSGRMRKYYTITSEGMQRLSEMREDWQAVIDIIGFISLP